MDLEHQLQNGVDIDEPAKAYHHGKSNKQIIYTDQEKPKHGMGEQVSLLKIIHKRKPRSVSAPKKLGGKSEDYQESEEEGNGGKADKPSNNTREKSGISETEKLKDGRERKTEDGRAEKPVDGDSGKIEDGTTGKPKDGKARSPGPEDSESWKTEDEYDTTRRPGNSGDREIWGGATEGLEDGNAGKKGDGRAGRPQPEDGEAWKTEDDKNGRLEDGEAGMTEESAAGRPEPTYHGAGETEDSNRTGTTEHGRSRNPGGLQEARKLGGSEDSPDSESYSESGGAADGTEMGKPEDRADRHSQDESKSGQSSGNGRVSGKLKQPSEGILSAASILNAVDVLIVAHNCMPFATICLQVLLDSMEFFILFSTLAILPGDSCDFLH